MSKSQFLGSRQANNSTANGVSAAIDRWLVELLDLKKSNRLLYFKLGRGARTLLHPDPASLFDGLVNHERAYSFYLPEEDAESLGIDEQLALVLDDKNGGNSDMVTPGQSVIKTLHQFHANEIAVGGDIKKAQATLYRLRLKSRMALQEQGTNVLFVACGTLEWTESESSDEHIVSPLFLIPVQLNRETALAPYILTPLDESVVFNPTLARKLELDFKLNLGLPDQGERELTFEAAINHIRGAIRARRTWIVHEDVYLGLFSFAKYAMYTDFTAHRTDLSTHPIVRLISGEEDMLPEQHWDFLTADRLDDETHPSEVFQVLDADASQQEAIAAIKAGANLVIQGPPGTGKSQTITNVIGESLAQGKTVPFVSEKMAALRVVAKRLQEAGLKEFCLEAHSQDINKATIIRDLAATLQGGHQSRDDASIVDLERIAALRRELNAYVRSLHNRNTPLGRSAYQIHGELARLKDVPIIPFEIPNVAGLTPQRQVELSDVVRQLARVGEALLSGTSHPWQGCILKSYGPAVQANIAAHLDRLASAAKSATTAQSLLRMQWGLPEASSLVEAEWLHDLLILLDTKAEIPPQWLQTDSLLATLATARHYQQVLSIYHEQRATLLTHYVEHIFDLDLEVMAHELDRGGDPYVFHLHSSGGAADHALLQRVPIKSAVEHAIVALDNLRQQANSISARLGLSEPDSIEKIHELTSLLELILRNPRPLREWFTQLHQITLTELADEALRQQEAISSSRSTIDEKFQDGFYEAATTELADRFEHIYASSLRIFRPAYHREFGHIRSFLKEGTQLNYAQARDALRQAHRIIVGQTWLEDHRAELQDGFGHYYSGLSTDWLGVRRALTTVRDIGQALGGHEVPSQIIDILVGEHGGPATLHLDGMTLNHQLQEAHDAITVLSQFVRLPTTPIDLQSSMVPLQGLQAWLNWLQRGLNKFWETTDIWNNVRQTPGTHIREMAADAHQAIAIRSIETTLAEAEEQLRRDFGQLFHGVSTEWETIIAPSLGRKHP